MIIENPEALKLWLTSYLPPLCDADPEVLAKYCLALVRKDRPNNELRASMVEQLDVFLKSHTESFVDKFLEVAKSKSYISKVPVTSATTTSSTTSSTSGLSIYTQAGNSPDSTTPTSLTQSQMPSPTPSSSISATINPVEPPLPPLPPLPPPVPVIPHPPPETTPPYPPKKEEVSSSVKPKKTDDKEKEDRRGKQRTRSRGDSRSGSQDKTRSVSRDRERNRRSRSRGRTNRSSKYEDRRRRSPHMKRFRRSRTRSRSPRWSRSPNRRSRSRDRRSRSRNRSRSTSLTKKHLPRHKTGSKSPLISSHPNSPISRLSPSKDDKDKSPSPDASNEIAAIVHSVVSIPSNQDPYSNTKTQRCRDYDVQGFCMRGDQCPFDHGADRVVLEGGAIEFPPPLQIAPPVTGVRYPVPSSHNSSLPQDIPGRSFLCHPPPMRPSEFGEYTPNNPGLWGGDIMPSTNYFGRGRGMSGPPPQFPGPPPSHPMGPIDRALINVIPANGLNHAKAGIRPSLAQRLGPAASRPSSLPNYVEGAGTFSGVKYGTPNEHNYTLELRKIPPGMNTITNLNQHFAKFGTIINIQVHHSLDPEAALVTFSSYSEANAAIRSTEAVLNNRFIKLFWHNASKSDAAASSHIDQRAVHERVIVRNPNKSLINKAPNSDPAGNIENNEKVVVSRGSLVKTVYNASAMHSTSNNESIAQDGNALQSKLQPSSSNSGTRLAQSDITESHLLTQRKQHLTTVEMKKQEIEAIQRQQELLKAEIEARQKVEKQKSEALKLKNEVELRTRQLLKEQMQHVKLLINKLEKNKAAMKPEEIRTLMETIKSLQAAVENTKAQLVATTVGTNSNTITQIKTRPQLDREILDTELELYTLQTEGRDVSHIKSRLTQLKAHAAVLRGKHSKSYLPNAAQMQSSSIVNKSLPYPVVARGRGSPRLLRGIRARGRGRGYGPPLVAVDRRTTCISASGFEREDKEEVMAHFQSLGAVSNYSWDDLTPAVCVQYASRKEAEKAIIEGRMLGDRLLNISWVAEPSCFANSSLHLSEPVLEDSAPNIHLKGPGSISARSTTPHSTTSVISNEDVEEITEEIVEEVTEEIGSFLYEDEGDDDEEEGGRSWRR